LTVDQLCKLAGGEPGQLGFQDKVDLFVAKGWSNPNFCTEALKILGLSSDLAPISRSALENQEIVGPISSPFKTLKDYQTLVFLEIQKRLDPPNSRFIVQMPTGSGKTRTAMELIAAYLNGSNDNSGNVLWLAHSGELCEQAASAFVDVWSHLGTRDVLLCRAWGSHRFVPPVSDRRVFIVGGFQKLYPLTRQEHDAVLKTFFKSVGLIVVDEAHKAIAPTYSDVINSFLYGGGKVVGLTATPGRSAIDEEQNQRLAQFFFEEMVGITAGPEGVIKQLQDRRVLAKARYDPLTTSINYELTAGQKKHLEKFYDLPPGFLRNLGNDDVRNIEILRKLQIECDQGSKIIFFACSVEHSRFISSFLRYQGYATAHVDGEIPYSKRSKIIEDFKSGDVQVLCNFGVLSTGFDVPKIDVVFIARPTASVVLYSQMIGRGLRGPEIGGTRTCKIVDVVDNIIGFSNENKIYDYFSEYWEN
jgi:DNA repair protein RadD